MKTGNIPGTPVEARPPGGVAGPKFIFTNWRETLHQAGVSPPQQRAHEEAIAAYLDYCANNGMSVAIESARNFMADAERRGLAKDGEAWREGIRWYFREGKKRGTPHPDGVPSLGQADTGRTAWESRLVERLRLHHYAWRTEQTYREWARRFAAFLGEREPAAATGADVKGFLSELAVKGRLTLSERGRSRPRDGATARP
jgi:hypothetical protein